MAASVWDDWETEEAPAAPAAAEPTTTAATTAAPTTTTPAVAPAPAPAAPSVWDDFSDTDQETFDKLYQKREPVKPKAEAADEPWAFTRGVVTGAGTTPEALGWAQHGLEALSGLEPGADTGAWLKQFSTDKTKYALKKDWKDLETFGDYMTFFGEQAGMGIGSLTAPAGGAAVGAAAGAAAGSVLPGPGTAAGAATGATAGLIGSSGLIQFGSMFQALSEDEAIKKQLAEGKVTQQQLAGYSIAPAAAMATLDVASLGALRKIVTGGAQEAVENVVRKSIAKQVAIAIAKGAGAEGITEATQQGVQEAATVLAGGDPELEKRIGNVIGSGIGGAIGGGTIGAGKIVSPDKVPPPPVDKTQAQTEPPPANGTQAGANAPDAAGGTSAASSTRPTGVLPDTATAGATAGSETTPPPPPPPTGGPTVTAPGAVSDVDTAALNANVPHETEAEEPAPAPRRYDDAQIKALQAGLGAAPDEAPSEVETAAAAQPAVTNIAAPTEAAAVNQPRPAPTPPTPTPAAPVAPATLPVSEQPAVQAPSAPPSPGPGLAGGPSATVAEAVKAAPPRKIKVPKAPRGKVQTPAAAQAEVIQEAVVEPEPEVAAEPTGPPVATTDARGIVQATDEWQEMPKGAIAPGGAQISADATTGKQYIRRAPEGAAEPFNLGTYQRPETQQAPPVSPSATPTPVGEAAQPPPAPTPPKPTPPSEPASTAEDEEAKAAKKAIATAKKRAKAERDIAAAKERPAAEPAPEAEKAKKVSKAKEEPAEPEQVLIKAKPKEEPKPKPEPPPKVEAKPEAKAPEAAKAKTVSQRRKPTVVVAPKPTGQGYVAPEAKGDDQRTKVIKHITNTLGDEIHTRVDDEGDQVRERGFDDPALLRQAAERATDEYKPGMKLSDLVERARRYYAELETGREIKSKEAEIEKATEARRTKEEEAAAAARAEKKATPQKTTRGDTKTAADIREETVPTTKAWLKSQLKKMGPKDLTPAGKKALQASEATGTAATALWKEARELRAQEAEAREKAAKGPERTLEEEAQAAVASEVEAAAIAEERRFREARAKPAFQATEDKAKKAFEGVTQLPEPIGRRETAEAWLGRYKAFAASLIKGVTGIPDKMSSSRPPYTNLLSLAKKLATPKGNLNALSRFSEGFNHLIVNGDEAAFNIFVKGSGSDSMSKAPTGGNLGLENIAKAEETTLAVAEKGATRTSDDTRIASEKDIAKQRTTADIELDEAVAARAAAAARAAMTPAQQEAEAAKTMVVEEELDTVASEDQARVEAAPEEIYEPPTEFVGDLQKDSRGRPIPGTAVNVKIDKRNMMSAADALKKYPMPKMEGLLGEGFNKLNEWLDAALTKLVGDVDIYFVTPAQLAALTGRESADYVAGFAAHHGRKSLAHDPKGRGHVFINTNMWTSGGREFTTHGTLRHELLHSATSVAQTVNLRFAAEIRGLMDAAEMAARRDGVFDKFYYSFTNEKEFLSESFGYPEFQQWLQNTLAPTYIREHIDTAVGAVKPTLWGQLVDAVRTLLGGQRGNQGQASLLDEVLRLTPFVMLSTQEQREIIASGGYRDRPVQLTPSYQKVALAEQRALFERARAASRSIDKILYNIPDTLRDELAADEVKSRWQQARRSVAGRKFRDIGTAIKKTGVSLFEAIDQGVQRTKADGVWKIADDGSTSVSRVQNQYEEIGPLVKRLKKAGFELNDKITRLLKDNAPLREPFADTIMDGSFEQVDFTTATPGKMTARQKAVHAGLHAQYLTWPQELRDATVELKEYFENQENRRLSTHLTSMFQAFTAKAGTTWPAGLATAEAKADWVIGGGIERAQAQLELDPKATGQDVEMYQAIEKGFADQLKEAGVQKVKGFYFPAIRRGDEVVAGRRTIKPPEGAELREGTDNILDFEPVLTGNTKTDKAAVKAAEKKAKAWRNDPANPRSTLKYIYRSSKTGEPTTASDGDAVRTGVTLKVMNEYVEFFHSAAEARDRRQELVDSGEFEDSKLSYAQMKDNAFFDGNNELAPMAVRRMLNVLDQRIDRGEMSNQIGQLVKWELANSAIRFMSGPSIKHRGLKKRGVEGASSDISNGLLDYNGQMASAIARLERADAISKAEKEVEAELKEMGQSRAKDAEWKFNAGDRLWKSMQDRYRNPNYDGTQQSHLMQGINALAFMNYLWTPQYWLTNFVQPGITAAKLWGEYGFAAQRHLIGAYRIMGLGTTIKILGKGLKATVGRKSPVEYFDMIKDGIRNSGHPEAAEIVALIERAETLGRVELDIPGVELERQLRGKPQGAVLKATLAASNLARQMPQAIEAINRTASMIASYNAARGAGVSVAKAKQAALDITSTTQFDYRPENRAAIFNTKYFGPALMFKQYGQGLMHMYVDMARRGMTQPGQRVKAARLFAGLTMFHWFFAGLQGAFPVEVVKLGLWAAHLLGLKDDDDNWDEYMLSLRKWFAKNYGKTAAEVLVKGPIHALGIDLSNSIQADSILLFKGLEKNDKKGRNQLLGEVVGGAPFAMGSDMFDALTAAQDGQYAKAAGKLPFPKFVKNIAKGYEAGTTGPTSPTGKQYTKPLDKLSAITKAAGFKPSSESDQQAVHFAQKAQDKEIKDQRNSLIGRHTHSKTAGDKAKAMAAIREWNKTHRTKEKGFISTDSLKRSATGAKTEAKKQRKYERQLENVI